MWTVRQTGKAVDAFRQSNQCDEHLWREIKISFAFLIEKGPVLAGTDVAERLKGGDGIWELKARHDHRQPRLLFYVRQGTSLLVFVHALLKKGKKDYVPAIKLAKERRRNAERGQLAVNVLVIH
jgi:hypothetical protein